MNILFIVPYPIDIAPSQRFRFEQYLDILRQRNYKITVKPFITQSQYQALYYGKNKLRQLSILTIALIKRLFLLITLPQYTFIFIHREATPVGPPLFEWFASKILKKKIIYDFDDAIWVTDKNDETLFTRTLKWRSKVASICRWSYKVSAGNQYLAEFALAYNPNVIVNPTTIDTKHGHNPLLFAEKQLLKKQNGISGKVIGWTGSHSTLKYLEQLFPVIQRLQERLPDTVLLVIADRRPKLPLLNMIFRQWSKETEVRDLMIIDIGIMPLPDDVWAKGKCGFKALQYMAMGIPAVVSPVGVNASIIKNGQNGFLCSTEMEWLNCLSMLLNNEEVRSQVGRQGRQTVLDHYSVSANTSTFLSLFN